MPTDPTLNLPPGEVPALFPEGVAYLGMRSWPHAALPPEIPLPASLANAARARQVDYVSGRLCARQALGRLGAAGDIPVGEDGCPVWPAGFVGSITHSNGFAFAAVARASRALSLGLDMEKIMTAELATQLLPMIATAPELAALAAPSMGTALLATILFSAKEAIFKCLYPLVRFRFDFTDVVLLAADPEIGVFSFATRGLPAALAPDRGIGRLAVAAGLVHAGLLLPPS